MELSFGGLRGSEVVSMGNLALWDAPLTKSPWRLLQKVVLQVDETPCEEMQETLRRAMPHLNESGKLIIMERPVRSERVRELCDGDVDSPHSFDMLPDECQVHGTAEPAHFSTRKHCEQIVI